MNQTIGLLGYDLNLSTLFVEKIINHTKADIDQEHIKMTIVINNKLLDKNDNEIINIIKDLENSNIDYLVLTFNNSDLYNLIKNNTNINILNNTFDINNLELIEKIITLCGKEVIM